MKKLLFLFIPLLLLAAVGCDGGNDGTDGIDGTDGLTPVVEVSNVAVGEEPCVENGGTVVTITIGDMVRTVDICNSADGSQGDQGPAGQDGQDGSQGPQGDERPQGPQGNPGEPITTQLNVATPEQCPAGGYVILIFQGGVMVGGDPIIICNQTFEFACFDETDNDGDGFTDCADTDCVGRISPDQNDLDDVVQCQAVETFCEDGFDNDGNGLTDLSDPNCVRVKEILACAGEIIGELITADLSVEFSTLNINQCTCDFTTFHDDVEFIEDISNISVNLIPDFGSDLSSARGACTTITSGVGALPTSFNVTINCANTVEGIEAEPFEVQNCLIQ